MNISRQMQSIRSEVDELKRGTRQLEALDGMDIPSPTAMEIQNLFEAKKAKINYRLREMLSEAGSDVGDQIADIDKTLSTLSGKVRQELQPSRTARGLHQHQSK